MKHWKFITVDQRPFADFCRIYFRGLVAKMQKVILQKQNLQEMFP